MKRYIRSNKDTRHQKTYFEMMNALYHALAYRDYKRARELYLEDKEQFDSVVEELNSTMDIGEEARQAIAEITGRKERYIKSSIDTQMYRGIWYGAKNNPISVKQLLDRVIEKDGRGFNIKVQRQLKSDDLMSDDIEITYYLTDEEGRGKFKLSEEAVDYLINNLSEDSYLLKKLI